MVYPGHRTRIVARIFEGLILILLTSLSFSTILPVQPQTTTSATEKRVTDPINNGTVSSPQEVGAYSLHGFNLPKTVVSSLTSIIDDGGVRQSSSQNLTLYNLALSMRLLGGPLPHDELLGPRGETLSAWSFWNVAVKVPGQSVPLLPMSNNFTLLGTNSSGTYVQRTMHVASGLYSGDFEIIYRASSTGPLKWDLAFSPNVSGNYQLIYNWSNLTSESLLRAEARSLSVRYFPRNYTLTWSDVPSRFNLTTVLSSTKFSLMINLGSVTAGSRVEIDPTIASGLATNLATAYTFQRRVFFDSQNGYYFAFYFDGYTDQLSSSPDGVHWSKQSMPSGWPSYTGDTLSVLNVGQQVFVAGGDYGGSSQGGVPATISAAVYFAQGSVSGPSINWQPTQTVSSFTLNSSGFSFLSAGYRYVNIALSSKGNLTVSYNVYQVELYNQPGCGTVRFSNSTLVVLYEGSLTPHSLTLQTLGGTSDCSHSLPDFSQTNQDRSILVPSDSNGKVEIIYQYEGTNAAPSLMTTWYDGKSQGPTTTLQSSVPDNDQFSAAQDTNYGIHLVYAMSDGTASYAYQESVISKFGSPIPSIFGRVVSYPTVTLDYSTNDIYVLSLASGPNGYSVILKSKSLFQNWSDQVASYPITGRKSSAYLTSNTLSTSATNASQIAIVWSEGSGPQNVTFASIPIETGWSPYSPPGDPWDGNGLAPYGQYFRNLGESVSPSTGMLTVQQTDMSVSGRGLNLDLTRVYAEPRVFLNGTLGYENYPWAPLGNGWQLNFPWMENKASPAYIHLWDGQGYRIPSSFWNTAIAAFENHQGENFLMTRNGTGILPVHSTGQRLCLRPFKFKSSQIHIRPHREHDTVRIFYQQYDPEYNRYCASRLPILLFWRRSCEHQRNIHSWFSARNRIQVQWTRSLDGLRSCRQDYQLHL